MMDIVFVDTNIVIDLLAKREAFYKEAQELFTLADKGKVQICVSALTFANAHYSIARHHKSVDVRKYLSTFKVLVNVLPLNDKTIELALASDFEDFEDGLQYFTALENNCDAIITRNKRDFKSSVIPIMTAGEYLYTSHNLISESNLVSNESLNVLDEFDNKDEYCTK